MSARSIIATALWIITVVIHTVNANFGGKISAIKIHDYAATRTKGVILELFIFFVTLLTLFSSIHPAYISAVLC